MGVRDKSNSHGKLVFSNQVTILIYYKALQYIIKKLVQEIEE